ncbi:hypothetical protein ACIBI9_67595 [Nonomuraea sp. NPDC050451]
MTLSQSIEESSGSVTSTSYGTVSPNVNGCPSTGRESVTLGAHLL